MQFFFLVFLRKLIFIVSILDFLQQRQSGFWIGFSRPVASDPRDNSGPEVLPVKQVEIGGGYLILAHTCVCPGVYLVSYLDLARAQQYRETC